MTSHDDHQDQHHETQPASAEAEQPIEPAQATEASLPDPLDAPDAVDETLEDGRAPRPDRDEHRGRGGRKPRDPRRRGGEWGAMPGRQHVHDEHEPHEHEPHGHDPREHDPREHDGHGRPHDRHDPEGCREHRSHGFGPGPFGTARDLGTRDHHGFGPHRVFPRRAGAGPRPGFVPDGDGRGGRPLPDEHEARRHGRGRRMDARILRTARTIRRAEHVLGVDEVEQTLRESVSHADYVTTIRTLRTLSRAVKARVFEAR